MLCKSWRSQPQIHGFVFSREFCSLWYVPYSGVASPKLFLGGKMFDCRWATAFCSGYCFSKLKVTRYAKNFWGACPLGLPGCANAVQENCLLSRGTCFVFNFTLNYEAYTSNQTIVATYEHVTGFRAYWTLLGCIYAYVSSAILR